ncbi:hypothetical protein [Bradyrhizobium arachidis]|uniref:Uncharacterized protein n=1 Tax=Bradyrhizobium arachidis TaxID=858423 RepID=A0AAE7TFU7_9BRAD|nr:hypothetical protein [Bradyrhizobium arachidis]QOZ67163.1 hypothetical protein WN72_13190 [Bradyrhizobium arachidis]
MLIAYENHPLDRVKLSAFYIFCRIVGHRKQRASVRNIGVLHEGTVASEMMRVVRCYGEQEGIVRRLSWRALVALSGPALPAEVRHSLDQRILAGERISLSRIAEAHRGHS